MVKNKLRGVIVALLTSFNKNGQLDMKAIEKHIGYLLDKKINGLFIAGTTGLGLGLTFEEKKKLLDLVVDVVNHEIPIIMHVTSIIYPELLKTFEYINKKDIHAVSVTTPYFYSKIDEKGLINYFSTIAKKTNKSIYLYNQPKYTGLSIHPKIVRELIDKYHNIVGIKDSSGDLTQLFNYLTYFKDKLNILVGGDHLFLPALMLGADGIISALANIIPELFTQLYECFKKGNLSRSLEIQDKIIRMRNVIKIFPQLSGYYAAGKILGLPVGYPRIPIRRLTLSEIRVMRRKLRDLGFLT